MGPRRKIIIDTDPGVDDVLAILLALASRSDELEILLISLTYGNVEVDKCLRNVVHLFYHIQREIEWRKSKGLPTGFDALLQSPPLVAIGTDKPLADDILMADYFHGIDGLQNISETHPHLSPSDTWKKLFQRSVSPGGTKDRTAGDELTEAKKLFRPSSEPAHEEILRLLREHDAGEITLVAVGPMTNTALAAAADPETFLKVKEVVVMGGTINVPGNITPVAEFNTFADSYAAARVYALTSPRPATTMPPVPPKKHGNADVAPPPFLSAYPEGLSRQLRLTLVPLDITSQHLMMRADFQHAAEAAKKAGSPLATWVDAFVSSTFHKVESLRGNDGGAVGLELHDPLCIWYCLRGHESGWKVTKDEDIRVETSGQWTRGMNVIDKRDRKKRPVDEEGERPGDTGNWLLHSAGNRMQRLVKTPGGDVFAAELLQRLFADVRERGTKDFSRPIIPRVE